MQFFMQIVDLDSLLIDSSCLLHDLYLLNILASIIFSLHYGFFIHMDFNGENMTKAAVAIPEVCQLKDACCNYDLNSVKFIG